MDSSRVRYEPVNQRERGLKLALLILFNAVKVLPFPAWSRYFVITISSVFNTNITLINGVSISNIK